METNWLEDFIDLSKTRSFSRSADNRCVTHPAFGRRIRALEDWVGVALVERGKNPVTLTSAGQIFLEAAKNALQGLHETRLLLREVRMPVVLKLGIGRTLSRTFLPGWYERLYQQCGKFPISITTEGTQEAILALAEGKTDLLIAYVNSQTVALLDAKKYESCQIGYELLVPVSAPSQRGQARFVLPGRPESPVPWLGFARGLTLRQALDSHLALPDRKAYLTQVLQADFYEAIEEMALRGFGLAWLPLRLVKEDLATYRLCLAGGSDWNVRVEIYMFRVRGTENPILETVWRQAVANAAAGPEAIV